MSIRPLLIAFLIATPITALAASPAHVPPNKICAAAESTVLKILRREANNDPTIDFKLDYVGGRYAGHSDYRCAFHTTATASNPSVDLSITSDTFWGVEYLPRAADGSGIIHVTDLTDYHP